MTDVAVYGLVAMGCLAALYGLFLVQGFRSGTMQWGAFSTRLSGDRRTEPMKFWTATVLNAIPVCLVVIGAILIAAFPHGIGR